MPLFLPKWRCFCRNNYFSGSVQAKTSLPKEYILAEKDCFGRIKAVSAKISYFGRTTENNFYRIKCFCRIIGRIIDRLFGRYDIRLPTKQHYVTSLSIIVLHLCTLFEWTSVGLSGSTTPLWPSEMAVTPLSSSATGWLRRIELRKWNNSECCLRDFILEI